MYALQILEAKQPAFLRARSQANRLPWRPRPCRRPVQGRRSPRRQNSIGLLWRWKRASGASCHSMRDIRRRYAGRCRTHTKVELPRPKKALVGCPPQAKQMVIPLNAFDGRGRSAEPGESCSQRATPALGLKTGWAAARRSEDAARVSSSAPGALCAWVMGGGMLCQRAAPAAAPLHVARGGPSLWARPGYYITAWRYRGG